MIDFLSSLSPLQLVILCVLACLAGTIVACAIVSGNSLPRRKPD